jgi:membrane protein required for colicin V production
MGTAAALALVFIVAYVVLRLIGTGIARRVQRTNLLGALDRTVGLAIGLARGLIVLGALYLMFVAATPKDLQPRWITKAALWPAAQAMGRLLTEAAPKGLDIAGRLKPVFDRAAEEPTGDRTVTDRYHARGRDEMDDPEKSR